MRSSSKQCIASKKVAAVIFYPQTKFWAQFVLAQTLFTLNSSQFISLDHISSKCIALHILCSCALTYDQRENLQIAVCTAVNADHVREAVKYYFALNSSHLTSLDPILPNCIALHILCSCALTYMISVRICRLQIVVCTTVNADHVTNLVASHTKLEDSALRCFEVSALV